MKKILVVIPSLSPQEELIDYTKELIANGFESILIVNDGSREEFDPIFDTLRSYKEVEIYKHAKNLGKGRALKNSINYFLNLENTAEFAGIITVDSDGQHKVSDVIKIRDAMLDNPTKICFGSRNFNESHVPPKSSFGNKLTSGLFKLLYGKKITDTQTGLRGIPREIVPLFIDLKGERFEYETNMLISAVLNDVEIKEIEIETVYFDNNSETHFRPIADSISIIGLLLETFFKYILSSLSSFIIDIGLFQMFVLLFGGLGAGMRIFLSTALARTGSSLFNYKINKNIVFENKEDDKHTIFKYFSLVIIQLMVSAILVYLVYEITNYPETLIKTLVDTVLFFLSYRIQKLFIFKNNKHI